jgi:predicted nucleic acid-binding protein
VTELIDTGPIVALLNRRDEHHVWTRDEAGMLDGPLHTCEAVLAEAHHLLSGVHDGSRRLNDLLASGRLDVSFRYQTHLARVHELMDKYSDVPMSFADACLVTLSETFRSPRVFTFDADFRIYRRKGNRPIALLSPA